MLADPYDTQKLNRYAYVRNNPVKYTDPSGNFLLPSIAIAGLIALDYGITAYDAYRANSVINNPSSTVEQRTQAQMDLANTLAFEQADIGWAAGAVLPTDDIARKVLGSDAAKYVSRQITTLSDVVSDGAITMFNNSKGWKVGDPVNNLTNAGKIPSWSTVRNRFWKNEATLNSNLYAQDQLERMQKGLAPQRTNPRTGKLESMELHHNPAQRDGGLFDVNKVWPEEHAEQDIFRFTGN